MCCEAPLNSKPREHLPPLIWSDRSIQLRIFTQKMLLDKNISSSIFEITIWSDLYGFFLIIRFKCDHMRQLDMNKWRISSMPAATVTPLQPSLFDMHHSFPAIWYVTMIKKTVEPIRSKVIHALTKTQFAKVGQNVNLFDKEVQIAWFNSKPVWNYNIVNLTRIMIFFPHNGSQRK